ncbi:energy transducer TonB [uncultured Maribacter sp.]|uniref:energy transducer TonB n=1 Tax=uncultured Maribacter sp. TaxID=431308 RepID=UPI00261B6DC8|nr:energy transducer TonB [uncultured Maribacter sp.]
MEVKKNPKADLNRDSGLFFVIGLTIVLFVTWRALEYKTYTKNDVIVEMLNVADDLEEEVPQTKELRAELPPPPPAAPEIIEIVEDTEDIEETIIESTESSENTIVDSPILNVDDVEVGDEIEEEIIVPFAVIENVPIFPGCEKYKTNAERKKCFAEGIQAHVIKQFTYPESAADMGVKGRVFVLFAINNKGYITGVKTRGPDPRLEKEASRIVTTLPRMTPGMQRGKAVKVPYSIPINFVLK